MHYCEASINHAFHQPYHDLEYGFPCHSDAELFELLSLEINQAGLSWLTILKKRAAFKQGFCHFDIQVVANFNDDDKKRLLSDAGIIRNHLKIEAVMYNAKVLLTMLQEHGSMVELLDNQHQYHQNDLNSWLKWFRKNFKFVGGEIVKEFLMSCGYLPGAHHNDCPIHAKVLQAKPRWLLYVSR